MARPRGQVAVPPARRRLRVGVVAALATTYPRSVMAGLAAYAHAHGP